MGLLLICKDNRIHKTPANAVLYSVYVKCRIGSVGVAVNLFGIKRVGFKDGLDLRIF